MFYILVSFRYQCQLRSFCRAPSGLCVSKIVLISAVIICYCYLETSSISTLRHVASVPSVLRPLFFYYCSGTDPFKPIWIYTAMAAVPRIFFLMFINKKSVFRIRKISDLPDPEFFFSLLFIIGTVHLHQSSRVP